MYIAIARYDAVVIACESNRGPGKLSRQTLDGGPSSRCLTACSDTDKVAVNNSQALTRFLYDQLFRSPCARACSVNHKE